MLNVAVLCSKRAPGLEALLQHSEFNVVCVMTTEAEFPECGVPVIAHPIRPSVILSRADGEGPVASSSASAGNGSFGVCAPQDDTARRVRRLQYDADTAALLVTLGVDAVICLGYLYVLTEPMLSAFPDRIFNIHDADGLIAFYDNGHGPLSEFPLWVQALLFVVASDFMLYWLHRMFHRGGFWKYHAIHHSSEHLEWISAARFHPVNLFIGTILVDVILLMAGISPNVMLWVGPFTTFHSAFVHANLNWTLGPFKYVLATPVFHRWHHTSLEEGGNTNFAGTFPIWDILFGTFRMPKGTLPDQYGVDDQSSFPREIIGQLAYPFRK